MYHLYIHFKNIWNIISTHLVIYTLQLNDGWHILSIFHENDCIFYPRPVLAFGYCRCLRLSVCPSVRVCGNHLLVRTITHHPFKLGSPNLDHRCKRPWLRSLLFLGVIDLDLQGQIQLQSQNLPHFELVCAITSSPVQARATKFGPEVLNTLVKIPVVLGVDWAWHVKFNLFSKSCLFASLLRLWNICETCKKRTKRSLFHILNSKWLRTNMFAHRNVWRTVEQSGCIFSVTIAGFPVLDFAIGNGFLHASVGFR